MHSDEHETSQPQEPTTAPQPPEQQAAADPPPAAATERTGAKWVRRLLPLLVLIVGVLGTAVILKLKKPPKRKHRTAKGLLVEVIEARPVSRRIEVRSHGTIQPRRRVALAPEVAGKVTHVHPSLVVGGVIGKGQLLVRLSPVDYRLALEQSRVQVAQAQRSLAEARSNANVARREWKIIGKRTAGAKGAPNPLTLGLPQLKQAQAGLAGAKARVKQARVNLGRTVIRAPFNLRVSQETVEPGQYALPGQAIATVFGTDEAEVIVPLAVSELRWIDIPRQRLPTGRRGKKTGGKERARSKAWVHMRVGDKVHRRPGRLERTVGEIDVTGRLTKVVVAVEDPYYLRQPPPSDGAFRPDFEVGAFVEVVIEGKRVAGVVPLPSQALRLGSTVWVAGADKRLHIRKVTTVRLGQTEALVRGLKAGEQVIVTPIGAAVEGMKIRIAKPRKPLDKKLSAEAPRR